jgi:hypothetical protein
MTSDTKIWITFAIPGIHCYPQAPEDVAYLRSPHRHLFKFKVTVEVFHDDREIEFHQLLNWCRSQYAANLSVDYKSCEMMARELLHRLRQYSTTSRFIEVEVSEDGECGAIVSFDPLKG